MTLEEAEALLHALAREFGGDPAATDATRVLRLPGLANKKYRTDFYVGAERHSTETYSRRARTITRASSANHATKPLASPSAIGPSQNAPLREEMTLKP
jgi:RepB DNA-primase from phage plasmid